MADTVTDGFDLVVVGAGIVGLAHALAARRLGLSVAVIDREAEAIGASVRNFGFVTVTGQRRGETWARAKRSAEIWQDVATRAGIAIEHSGLLLLARRPEAADVIPKARGERIAGVYGELFRLVLAG
jgi:glycine/D-amino acid oxidase-like deaminating enzyme